MKQIVKPLIGCLTAMLVNGCGSSTVFERCVTPGVPKIQLDDTPRENILDNAKRVVGNYQMLKKENEALRRANEVCK